MRQLTLLAVLFVVSLGWPQSALAKPSGNSGTDGIGASAGSSTPSTSPVESTAPVVLCEWGSSPNYYSSGRSESGPYVYTYIDQLYWRIRPSTGEVWVQTQRICREGDQISSSTLEWRRVTAPDPEVLAQSLYDEVVRQVPVPEPALSPVGPGFVNLGMWLAVAEPPPISVTATAGTAWATTSAELVSTTFDMGDGTVVVCDGAGDPIPASEMESLEESPVCGHTYRGVNGREPFVVTITSSWRVSWVGSGGAGGELGALDRSSSLQYEVLEIQTVGS
jgi:hypothetical protein